MAKEALPEYLKKTSKQALWPFTEGLFNFF